MPRLVRPALSLLLLGFVVSRVSAQNRDTTAADSVRLAGRARQSLPPILVTGTLSTFSQDKLGMARSVLSAAQLRGEPARTALDPLRRMTGVFIDEANGPLGPAIIRIRGGEETFTQVLVDGVPINENGGFFDAEGLTLGNVERVEVARGPQSAVYGSSAISGVVQMFTRAGEVGPLRADVALEGERATEFGGSRRASVFAGGGSDALRFALGLGSTYDRGPHRLPNDLRANDASLRVDLLTSRHLALTAVGRFMGVDAKLPVRDPGITRAPLDPNQRQGRDRTLGSLLGTWSHGNRWIHRASVSHYRRDFTYEDTSDGLDQSQFSFYVFDANYYYKSVVRRSIARYVATASGQPRSGLGASLSFGGEWQRESLSDEQRGDFGPSRSSIARPSTSAFGEGQIRLANRVSFLLGSRLEKFNGLDAAFVPRATAVLDIVRDRLSLRAGASGAYKAPNIQDQFPNSPVIVSNPDLEPETSRSVEAGADFTARTLRTNVGITYFRQTFDNLIRSVSFDSTRQINRNLGRSRAAGLELDVALVPRDRWSVGGGAAWIATRIVDNGGLPSAEFPNGGSLPFRPNYTATAYIGAPVSRTLSLLLRSSLVGRQTVLTDRFLGNRVSIAPYDVLSATANWRLAATSDAYLQVQNLLNKGYATAYDRTGTSRTAAVGLRLSR